MMQIPATNGSLFRQGAAKEYAMFSRPEARKTPATARNMEVGLQGMRILIPPLRPQLERQEKP
jgi:hypothetical protein